MALLLEHLDHRSRPGRVIAAAMLWALVGAVTALALMKIIGLDASDQARVMPILAATSVLAAWWPMWLPASKGWIWACAFPISGIALVWLVAQLFPLK